MLVIATCLLCMQTWPCISRRQCDMESTLWKLQGKRVRSGRTDCMRSYLTEIRMVHDVWIIPTPFCAMHDKEYRPYLPVVLEPEADCVWLQWNNRI